jgi:hypothetical protein
VREARLFLTSPRLVRAAVLTSSSPIQNRKRSPSTVPASRIAPAAYDGTGEPAQHGDIGVETDFRDGHLRHDDLKKPLTSQL